MQLGWMPQGDAVDYTVWHGDEAYWQPGEAGTTMLFTGASTSFAHAVAGDGNHHYYQVVAHTTSGDDLSATVGKFSHQLHPGFNKVPQPLDTGVTDAQAFASMHGDYLQSVHLFDETLQDFRTWYAGYGEPPFGLGLGQVPIVSADWQAEEMVYEEVGRVPAEDELQIPLLAGMNLVTVPLSMGDTTASAVLALVPGAWRVGQWHSNGQYREWHEEGAPDFPVEAGEDIYVDTTVESMWPPPPPSPPPSHEGVNPLDGMGAVQPVATGFQFTEGPLWLASEGALLFTDLAGDQIWRYEPGVGTSLVRDVSGRFTNGMTFDINGDRIECQHATQQVVRVEADGSETTLATEWNGVTLNSPNDVVVGPDGSLYFADATVGAFAHLGNVQNMPLGFQGLYRIDPEGVLHLIDDIFADPTGMGISPQGDMLYVSDWGTGLVHSYPINPDGSVGPGSVLTDLTPQPDGMCLDMEGNIYVTTNQGLHIMEPDGTPWGLLVLPETPASNCAFGGPERTTLYITDFTGVYAVDVTIPGAPPFGG
ncbi:MAG: SMP-30/gluconolactonase/LRE family protein [Myxococcota bacterium]